MYILYIPVNMAKMSSSYCNWVMYRPLEVRNEVTCNPVCYFKLLTSAINILALLELNEYLQNRVRTCYISHNSIVKHLQVLSVAKCSTKLLELVKISSSPITWP
jgi:hypothetical protein